MSLHFQVEHTTEYRYPSAVSYGQNIAYLIPRTEPNQSLISWVIKTEPETMVFSRRKDYFDNEVLYFAVEQQHERLIIKSSSRVKVDGVAGVAAKSAAADHSEDLSHGKTVPDSLLVQVPAAADCPWELVVHQLANPVSKADIIARQFCFPSPRVQANKVCSELAKRCFLPGRGVIESATELMTLIYQEFTYTPNVTHVDSLVADVVKAKVGVCQDFAHVAISGLRSMGLAAAYVSGYLETVPPPGVAKLRGSDASHAWYSIYLPNLGWLDFDPTNNKIPDGQHIVVARGRDFGDVTPLKGTYRGSVVPELFVAVDVNRVSEEKAFL